MNFKSMTIRQLENLFVRYYNRGMRKEASLVVDELNRRLAAE